MKKVLLLGDSIRMGYDDYVKEILRDKCEVIYAPEDNDRLHLTAEGYYKCAEQISKMILKELDIE
jgi:hypothetical protein